MKSSLTAKLFLAALAAAAVAGPALRADEPRPDASRPERRGGPGGPNLEQLSEQLGLSADQKARLAPVLKSQAEKLRALRDDQSLDRSAKMEKMRAIREEGNKAIAAVLTPEQVTKFHELREKMRERGPRGDKAPK